MVFGGSWQVLALLCSASGSSPQLLALLTNSGAELSTVLGYGPTKLHRTTVTPRSFHMLLLHGPVLAATCAWLLRFPQNVI